MTRHEVYPDYHESYEYHGNTAIEITRKRGRMTLKQDWIFFDSVEEAQDFDGILDCIFMVMILMMSILGTLCFGL
ncbi:MAG: hypothetical protein JRE61_11455 [Deltaproteobacteria bacterium]|nr:hypothetical protein [Deltaproteobacteria bacterium]